MQPIVHSGGLPINATALGFIPSKYLILNYFKIDDFAVESHLSIQNISEAGEENGVS